MHAQEVIMSKKEDAAVENHAQKTPESLEAMILNYSRSRYDLVNMAIAWAHVVKKKQEYQHLRKNEILATALHDILSGKVDAKTIEKERRALEAALQEQEQKENEEKKEEKADHAKTETPKELLKKKK